MMMAANDIRPINLALQGGGSHGAFTWGVIDRLLEDGRLKFAAVSGTSAGAMNAVALADGWARGGSDGARERLHAFWRAVAVKGRFSPVQRMPWDVFWGNWSVENTPGFAWFDLMSRAFSPYAANPFNINPLRDVVENEINFDNLKAPNAVKVFVSATNVETGQLRVFNDGEIGADAVMASACLPQIFRAVEIDGVPYWDGGYGGNPAIAPFFRANDVADVLLVQINPVIREGTPKTANEIQNRVDEITFNSALLRELTIIERVNAMIALGQRPPDDVRGLLMHRIDADEAFKNLSASSKLNAEWAFLEYLRDLGRQAAGDWLEENFEKVGKEATLKLGDGPGVPVAALRSHGLGRRVREFLASRRQPEDVRRPRR
jgi:NTE family protein